MMRSLILAHRYLGTGVGLLMVVWCLSGIVMMYVPYPQLTEAQRVAHLSSVDLRGCCEISEAAWPATQRATSVQLEMLGTRLVLRAKFEDGPTALIDLRTGNSIHTVSRAEAASVAAKFAARGPTDRELRAHRIDHDQWTVQGARGADRPLYSFGLGDARGTEVYVSSRSGQGVQITTARERFWNWLGSVPHWIYFSALRQNGSTWSHVVVLASTLGCFLALTGLYLGVRAVQGHARRGGSAYRGLHYWHHLLGLMFGIFILTWVASGLISMNPWGFLAGKATHSDADRAPVALHDAQRIKAALRAIARQASAANLVSLHSVPLDGRLFLIGTTVAGQRIRLDEKGNSVPLSPAERSHIARILAHGGSLVSASMITLEDDYYFSHHRERAQLPAYRVILGNSDGTRYYIDPVSGEVLRRIDRDSRWYRWLHQALHRADFSASLRASALRDVLMIILLTGMSAVCAIGAYLGIRRSFAPNANCGATTNIFRG